MALVARATQTRAASKLLLGMTADDAFSLPAGTADSLPQRNAGIGNIATLEKLLVWQDLGNEPMIRSLFVAMALAFTSISAFADETCIASHYGYSGGRTASGERMDPSAMTAAHRTRSFGSQVIVTSQSSGRSISVRINDRGPFVRGRCIDLSTGAARELGMADLEKVSIR